MALLGFATCATFAGFQLLLSVVPLYADRAGGGSTGAGLATAALMLATVLTQIQMPRLLGRLGYRAALAAGLVLLEPRPSSTGPPGTSPPSWPSRSFGG